MGCLFQRLVLDGFEQAGALGVASSRSCFEWFSFRMPPPAPLVEE